MSWRLRWLTRRKFRQHGIVGVALVQIAGNRRMGALPWPLRRAFTWYWRVRFLRGVRAGAGPTVIP